MTVMALSAGPETLTQRKKARKVSNRAKRAAAAYVAEQMAPRADDEAPTDERRQHGAFDVTRAISGSDGEPAAFGSKMHRSQSPIERYERRREISKRQATAANRLRDDWEIGIVGVRRRDMLGAKAAHGAYGYSDLQIHAATNYQRAVQALGKLLCWIVLTVVLGDDAGGDVTVGMIAKSRGDTSTQQLFGVFKHGLDVLAEHYGLP